MQRHKCLYFDVECDDFGYAKCNNFHTKSCAEMEDRMNKHWKTILASFLVLAIFILMVTVFHPGNSSEAKTLEIKKKVEIQHVVKNQGAKAPKYIFLFIGDGMSYPQIQAASYYLGATASGGQTVAKELSFMNFPIAGSAQTYDSTSFCPDSASTVTSIATGNKTCSGTLNMDTAFTKKYETIAEKLKKQMDYKIGIISTVNINHATPAGFYAHQSSRNNYYEIGLEMIKSNFDYFAGGALKKTTGNNNDQKNLYKIAEDAGYKVIKTQKEAQKFDEKDGRAIIIAEALADSDSMSYDIDAKAGEWRLADYVEKGIKVLGKNEGFFMMIEGGKIDWACHANDAATSICDTVALDNAVEIAIEFYNDYPDETLILVTGDHETGGLSIGFAGTEYDTYLRNIKNQKISYAKFDSEYITKYKKNNTRFSKVLKDIEENFGLVTKYNKSFKTDAKLVLTDYEYDKLKRAYNMTMKGAAKLTQEEYVLYGKYEPLTVTITHILNNKSGIDFTSYCHTGIPVAVFAIGNGAELFEGYYDNTDIYKKLAKLTNVK
jgi:alkaline phosphatase